jgi:hypothetical protein
MWNWLRDENNQGALKLIGAAFAAVVLAAWAYFQWYESRPKPPAPEPPTVTISYKVCRGEFENRCSQHDVFIGCDDLDAWAKKTCIRFSSTELNVHDGNHCGYTVANYTCTQKLPQ